MSEMEIVQVTGRWATLVNGDHVTSIPPFHEFDHDAAAFEARIAEFQAAPAAILGRDGITERIPARRPQP